jgi:hypothetical protein
MARWAGRVHRVDAPEGRPPGDYFVADITEVVFTHLDDDATTLIVEW